MKLVNLEKNNLVKRRDFLIKKATEFSMAVFLYLLKNLDLFSHLVLQFRLVFGYTSPGFFGSEY